MKQIDFLKLIDINTWKYPNIHLDTFAYCNASCKFCGYKTMTRKKGKMELPLFHRIIDELATWDKQPPEIVPIHYGEFFLNPDWMEILSYMDNTLKDTKIAIPTNGTMLYDKIDDLIKIKNLHYINFSIYGASDETYREIMGLEPDFEKLNDCIKEIENKRPDITITIGATNDTCYISKIEQEIFKKKWMDKKRTISLHDITSNNQTGYKPALIPHIFPCLMIFNSLMILWDGKVTLCCYDINGELIVGDVNKEKILDIWQNKIKYYQDMHINGNRMNIPLCKYCTF